MESPRAVVFDFDYTLADSSRGVVECVRHALDAMGLPGAAAAAVRRTIGLPLADALVELAGPEQAGRSDEFVRLFLERADQVMAEWTVVLESTPRVVGLLRGRGARLGIVSNKRRGRIEVVLEREGLLSSFDAIVGAEDVESPKPDPTGLLLVIERLGTARADCLYAGDSVTDAETARRAGVEFVAVLSGVTARERFEPYPVRAVVDGVADLPGLVGG